MKLRILLRYIIDGRMFESMTLRKKTLLIIVITQFFWFTGHNLVMKDQFNRNLDKIEHNQAISQSEQIRSQIDQEFNFLVSKLGDYSGWDATYNFIEDHNPSYIKNDLGESMIMMGVNLMIFVDKNGNIVWSQGTNTVNNKLITAPKSITEKYLAHHPLSIFDHKSDETRNGKPYHRNDQMQGIVRLPEGIMLMVSRPIIKTDYSGPARGYMVIGKWIDEQSIGQLSQLTKLHLSYKLIKDQDGIALRDKALIEMPSSNQIVISTQFKDIFNKPALSIVITAPRPINMQKISAARIGLVGTFLAMFLLIITTLWIIDRMVLLRIKYLKTKVATIQSNRDTKTSILLTGNDELSDLAGSINEMLASLEQSRVEQIIMNDKVLYSSRMATIGSLVSGFAHEINNPLTVAKGNLVLLEKHIEESMVNDPTTRNLIQNQDHALNRIITTMKQFRQLVVSVKADTSCINLHEIIEQSLQVIENRYQLDNIEVVKALYAPPLAIKGSCNKFQQVLLNLLTNAYKALKGRSPKRIIVQTELDRGDFVLKIADTGCGIEENKLATLFDPHTLVTSVSKGEGMGLSMIYDGVQELKGTITCFSRLQEGTVFTIRIPVPVAKAA